MPGQKQFHMYLSHINVTMPMGEDDKARSFYSGCLGLREIPKPQTFGTCGGLWFDVGGLELHISAEEQCDRCDGRRHFGFGCGDIERLKAKLEAAGVRVEEARQKPWKRFFVHDPFGNRIEIHAPGLCV